MRHRLAIAAALVATAALGSVAEAAIQKGGFKGTTTAKDPVGFRVPAKNRVSGFYFAGVRLTCTDGDQFDSGKGSLRLTSPSGKRYGVSSKRKFVIKVRNTSEGNGWTVRGKFASGGNKAEGTLSVYANFDNQNHGSQNGSIRCKSKTLKWTAKRK